MSPTNCSEHIVGNSAVQTHILASSYLFGVNLSWLLLAFLIAQTYTYYRQPNSGKSFLKFFVYGVVFLQILQTIEDSYAVYTYDAQSWGRPYAITGTAATLATAILILLDVLTGFVVQCFFVWRIFMFSKGYYRDKIKIAMLAVCVFISLVGLLALGSGLANVIGSIALPQLPAWFESIFFVALATTAATDLLITISMSCILCHARSQAWFGETRDHIAKIIQLTIQTGLLTSGLSLLVVALYTSKNGFFPLPWFALGKFYALSLLANLNACVSSNSTTQGEDVSTFQVQIRTRRFASPYRGNGGSTGVSTLLQSIEMSTLNGSSATHVINPVVSIVEEARKVTEEPNSSLVSGRLPKKRSNLSGESI